MKIPKIYIILVIISIIIFILVEMLRDRPVSWEPNFSSRETMPYGTFALYNLLPDLFPGKTIKKNFKNYVEMLEDKNMNNESIIIICSKFITDPYSINALLSYVEDGHQVLISAHEFDDHLMDTLGFKTQFTFNGIGRGGNMTFNFSDSLLMADSAYHFNFALMNYFPDNDSATYEVLGNYSNGQHNLIQYNIGQGKLILNTVPIAFTNFNILKGFTKGYAEVLFSMMTVNDVIWDEYIRHIEIKSNSPFRYILSVPTLRSAFVLLLLLTLLFTLFAGKRRQQIIPLIIPLENSTHRFIETLGRLYLYRNSHRDIAIKKIRFFREGVQTKYSIKIKKFDDEFVERFTHKSGMQEETVIQLVKIINTIEIKEAINENELFELNQMIDEFKIF